MQTGISIVICCYNSASRIGATIRHIALQDSRDSFQYEIILVDNASSDNTKEQALEEFGKYSYLNTKFFIIEEKRPGLTYARQAGIEHAKYDHVLLCDDDNWLQHNYLKEAAALISKFPSVDLFGSQGMPAYEEEPELWLTPFHGVLATGAQHSGDGFIYKPVYGACMIVKRSSYLALHKKGFRNLLTDRKGEIQSGGGDTELGWLTLLNGGKIYYASSLIFFHNVSSSRLNKKYFRNLILARASSNVTLAIYRRFYEGERSYFNFFLYFCFYNIKHMLRHLPKMWFGKHKFFHFIGFFHHSNMLFYFPVNCIRYAKQFSDIKSRL